MFFGCCQTDETARVLRILREHQIYDRELWKIFADQFGRPSDDADSGWRGEYWGKAMRGAVMLCEITDDAKLYGILAESVRYLLTKQEPDGRISTYGRAKEFCGWDMWCRKYVAVGLEYFLRICRDHNLKERILTALCRHLDYIIERIGRESGKIPITQTSHIWGGMNSSSILKSFVVLYEFTKEKKYLDFAEYILDEGGASGFNIFKAAEEGKIKPYAYPYKKAYEMISCFEGLLEYYKATGDERALDVCRRFADDVSDTEITVVGGCGCYDELFNHAALMQTVPVSINMQETCVTVSMMLYLKELSDITGTTKYQDIIERMYRNLYLGALNTSDWDDVNALPFDSYSPLIRQKRSVAVGGCKDILQNRIYGCCAAIGAAGLGVFLSSAVKTCGNTVTINQYINGSIRIADQSLDATLVFATKYPRDGRITITVSLNAPCRLKLRFRVPDGCLLKKTDINGKTVECRKTQGWAELSRIWHEQDTVVLIFDMPYRIIQAQDPVNGGLYCSVSRGPVVLAADSRLCDLSLPLEGNPEQFMVRDSAQDNGSDIAAILTDENGNRRVLIDYASSGKPWREDIYVSCWLAVAKDKEASC